MFALTATAVWDTQAKRLSTARKSTWPREPKKEKGKKKKARSIYQVADADSLNNLAQKTLQMRPLLDKEKRNWV